MTSRDQILEALEAFAKQRSGIEFGNYGDVKAFRAEQRSITKDLHHARTLLTAVRWRTYIGVPELRKAFQAFSGRLSLKETKRGVELDYCTGQYFPTEYRRAVCAVLASAIWEAARKEGKSQVDGYDLRSRFKREFGRPMADRWFS